MNSTKSFQLINGNKQNYTVALPTIVLRAPFNSTALAHLEASTGLKFDKHWTNYLSATPKSAHQIAKMFFVYDFKTTYQNNWNGHFLFLD